MEQLSFWMIWAVIGIGMFVYYLRRFHTVRSMLWGTGTGLAALLLLHYCGGIIGFSPQLNLFNLIQAGLLGVPGVILMTIVHFL